jgi:hypothetical protein
MILLFTVSLGSLGYFLSFYCLLYLKVTFLLLVAEEKALMYEKKLAIYEEIIKKCEASKAGVTSSKDYLLTQRKQNRFFLGENQ